MRILGMILFVLLSCTDYEIKNIMAIECGDKAVSIGENSIVAAYSFVTKNIPKNQIWSGIPAKLKKKIT